MRKRIYIGILIGIVALNILLQWVVARWDLTSDHRYTLSSRSRTEIRRLDDRLEIVLCLDGPLNSGFKRLRKATVDLLSELRMQSSYVQLIEPDAEQIAKLHAQLEQEGLMPVLVHERAKDGKTSQTNVYPYAILRYKGKQTVVSLLRQDRSKKGEENLNMSIEALEYSVIESVHLLLREHVERVAFLEGHGELEEKDIYDFSAALSRYYQIDRGAIGLDASVLNDYQAVIIADPQLPFSETDKYILDQYLMKGGKILWLVSGVKFSSNLLSEAGVTPIIAQDLHLTDMFFRYGVRVNPVLVQDLQCLNVPVDVSRDPENPQYQPIPWTYAPLLLTSSHSPITCNVAQVSTTFASCLEVVGGDDGIAKNVLLATSLASCLTGAPAEVDLSDLSIHESAFTLSYLPVAVSLEGKFSSVYAHRMIPEGVINSAATPIKESVNTRQVVVASGNVARNEWQQGHPLPVGYDRYSRIQFGNRDFLVNAVLWLTDDAGLIALRQKSIALRLINTKKSYSNMTLIQTISVLCPILLLLLVGGGVLWRRINLYVR